MKLIPNLSFDGKCAEALEYYKDIFDGEIIQAITYSEFDFGCDPLLKDKIFSGILIFGSNTLYMNDEKNEFNNCNFKFILEFFNEEDIKSIYEKLKIKGTILQVLEESSWGSLYAEIKDEFGITWGLNLEMGIL